MVPIYEQIIDQIKTMIRKGDLKQNDQLPSVRALSKELKISVLTVKKAYDELEREGFTVTVHGKGSYVTAGKHRVDDGRTEKRSRTRLRTGNLSSISIKIRRRDMKIQFPSAVTHTYSLPINKI